jgi:hypothetical protein
VYEDFFLSELSEALHSIPQSHFQKIIEAMGCFFRDSVARHQAAGLSNVAWSEKDIPSRGRLRQKISRARESTGERAIRAGRSMPEYSSVIAAAFQSAYGFVICAAGDQSVGLASKPVLRSHWKSNER